MEQGNLMGTYVRAEATPGLLGRLPDATIPALAALLDDLIAERIRFCLWKSNLRLHIALAGGTDLDLLVDRRDGARFRRVLARHAVKPVVPPARATYPGMEHFLGFDAADGRLFHLHVHFHLVLGQRYVKNHRLPLEDEFLRSTELLDGAPVPSPALELGVLSARALLKYRARDAVKDLLGIRSPGLAADILDEIGWLLSRTTAHEVRAALARAGDVLPSAPVGRFLDLVATAPRSGYRLVRLRASLVRSLTGAQRTGRVRASAAYLSAAWRERRRLRVRPPATSRLAPSGGGFTVALVGADGSGKSTLAAALGRWLGWKLAAPVYYMGSKQPSRASRWLYVGYRAQRRAHRSLERPGAARLARPLAAMRDATLALHHLSIGRDRARRHRAAARAAAAGAVVIFDRYPVEHLSRDAGSRLLDGPQIAAAIGGGGAAVEFLRRAEERLYASFRPPDYLFLLEVTPEVSAGRKPDHSPEAVRAKTQAVLRLASLAARRRIEQSVFRIDADRPLDEVLLEVKARLWDVL